MGHNTPTLRPGDRFGRLVVREKARWNKQARKTYWLLACDCGAEVLAFASQLKRGRKKSCGCLLKDLSRPRPKGMRHRLRRSWEAMMARCYNPKNHNYPEYGARGITVCDRWRTSFEAFWEDLGDRPPATSLGRKDGTRGYEPDNCTWESEAEQHDNRATTIWVTVAGYPESLRAACARLGVSRSLVHSRLKNGWSEALAFSKPKHVKKGALSPKRPLTPSADDP